MKNTLIAILFLLLPLLQACKKETPQEMRKRLISQKEAPKQTVDTTKTETIKDSVITLVPEPKVVCDTVADTISSIVKTPLIMVKPFKIPSTTNHEPKPKKVTEKKQKPAPKVVNPTPAVQKPATKKFVTYVVGKGDNYHKIGRSTNVPVKELIRLNRNKKLKIGDTIRLIEL
jgi:LysM repeat protein